MNALVLAVARRAIHELDLDYSVKVVIEDIEKANVGDARLQAIIESDASIFTRDVSILCGH